MYAERLLTEKGVISVMKHLHFIFRKVFKANDISKELYLINSCILGLFSISNPRDIRYILLEVFL